MLKFILMITCVALLNTACTADANKPADFDVNGSISAPDPNTQTDILNRMSVAAKNLKSYQADINFLFEQPLFETSTLRTGQLFFQNGKTSDLKIEFTTILQDSQPPTQQREVYLFDGVWLTQLDYALKQARRRQYAPKDEPVNAFELARQNFPLVGFAGSDELSQDFTVTPDPNAQLPQTVRLNLEVKPDSPYAAQYTQIKLWIDTKTALPARIIAVTTEEDIYTITFENAKINPEIDQAVFDLSIPADFGKTQVTPLENSK